MKVGLLSGPGRVSVEELPAPSAGPGEVVVELAACGVCGTDLEKVRGNYQSTGRLGHEPVGRIAEMGPGVAGLGLGDRVFVHHHVSCGNCAVCQHGEPTFCAAYSRTNIDPGGFAERFRVPAENVSRGAVLKLAPTVSWDVGALLEPAGCALTALRRCGLRRGDSVFILGLGPVGLLYAALARSQGASWVGGSELSERRRDAARRLGVDVVVDPREPEAAQRAIAAATTGNGVDLAVVATGAPAAVTLGFQLPRRGGTLNLFGLPEAGSRLDADLQQLYLRGVRVIPTYATSEAEIAEVHSLVASGQVSLDSLVTHRFPIDQIGEAFAQAGRADSAIKVVVTGPASTS
jgi:L-iditol 2-dehydrogenase